jgi:hypothetical protein
MWIAPCEAEILGKRLDRVVTRRPFGGFQDYIPVKIDSARRLEQPFDIPGRTDVQVSLLKLAIGGALVF